MLKIIVVEDEFRIRQGLSSLISKIDCGCQVIALAENGYEGVRIIRDTLPDVVITDISMPKMNGLEMIEKVKNIGIGCKFVILSGYANFEYAQKGIHLGVTDYLLKPVTITKVKELLEKLTTQDPVEEKIPENNRYSKVIADMVKMVEQKYGQRLGLDIFAEKYRLTPEYISNLFTKETGMSFSNYLKKVRIDHAIELILNTNMKIFEIGCQVGYPDQKYFSKVFKEYSGLSAKQYAMEGRNK
ncbi:MAG: response regulator [Anaerocolumna sp.]